MRMCDLLDFEVQAQDKFEVKSLCQDTFEHMQIEALKKVKSVDEALSLLKSLRDGSQISDSAHDSLSQAFMLFSKDQDRVASHSDKAEATQSPSKRRNELVGKAVLTAAVINVPERKSISRPFKDPSSKRQQLTPEEAAEIYSMRPRFAKGSTLRRGCMVKSKMIAPNFGVTAKTVRDIWHARTWACATRHLWTEEEVAYHAKGILESEDEDMNDSSGCASPAASRDNVNLNPYAHNWMALSALQNQAMMGGMSGLPFHMPFASTLAPPALGHPFSMEQQQAA
eukprot:1652585-Rhodomonas_salina.1